MKLNLKNVGLATVAAFTVMAFLLNLIPAAGRAETMKASAIVYGGQCVIIDAGHGGFDGGAVADDGTLEKDINLKISLYTADILKAMGFHVVLTRSTDTGLESAGDTTIRQKKITDMRKRLGIIEANTDALFVSVHLNKYTSPAPKGTQVFYSPNNEKSATLAECIQSAAKGLIQPDNNRKIKKAGKDTMLLYKAQIPAVIVECGFLSNAEELELLKTEEYQKKTAISIAAGIIEYIGIK